MFSKVYIQLFALFLCSNAGYARLPNRDIFLREGEVQQMLLLQEQLNEEVGDEYTCQPQFTGDVCVFGSNMVDGQCPSGKPGQGTCPPGRTCCVPMPHEEEVVSAEYTCQPQFTGDVCVYGSDMVDGECPSGKSGEGTCPPGRTCCVPMPHEVKLEEDSEKYTCKPDITGDICVGPNLIDGECPSGKGGEGTCPPGTKCCVPMPHDEEELSSEYTCQPQFTGDVCVYGSDMVDGECPSGKSGEGTCPPGRTCCVPLPHNDKLEVDSEKYTCKPDITGDICVGPNLIDGECPSGKGGEGTCPPGTKCCVPMPHEEEGVSTEYTCQPQFTGDVCVYGSDMVKGECPSGKSGEGTCPPGRTCCVPLPHDD